MQASLPPGQVFNYRPTNTTLCWPYGLGVVGFFSLLQGHAKGLGSEEEVVGVYYSAYIQMPQPDQVRRLIQTLRSPSYHPWSHGSKAHTHHDRSVRLRNVLDRTVGMQDVHNPIARGGLALIVGKSVTANKHQVLFLLSTLVFALKRNG
jgi:hypothetical protein